MRTLGAVQCIRVTAMYGRVFLSSVQKHQEFLYHAWSVVNELNKFGIGIFDEIPESLFNKHDGGK
jgi:hypothetical protein